MMITADILCLVFLLFIFNIIWLRLVYTYFYIYFNKRLLYMKLPFLTSFFIFIIVLTHRLHKSRNEIDRDNRNFWDRESRANSTRKKSLEGLDYIKIPLDKLPVEICADDDIVKDCIDTIKYLSTENIVNLTGFTNTDLKLEYGTANITALTKFDENYTSLAATLQKWADRLIALEKMDAAVSVMEFAVSTKTDVSRTYIDLAKYYKEKKTPEKINKLLQTAEELNSLSRDSIIKHLKEEL